MADPLTPVHRSSSQAGQTSGTPQGAEQRIMHERAVRLAFASRLAMMRTFATVVGASVLLAALLTPGGAPLAFPIAVRFAARILAEGRRKPTETVAKP